MKQQQRRQVIGALSGLHDLCPECPHYFSCRRPCKPVSILLYHENPAVIEKAYGDRQTGFIIAIDQTNRGIMRESSFIERSEEAGPHRDIQLAFSTSNGSPFAGNPKSDAKRTGVFIDRFFNRMSYLQIAKKYNTSIPDARKLYHDSLRRVEAVIEAMRTNALFTKFAGISEDTVIERMPKGQRWFLLHYVFNVKLAEIARIFGEPRKRVEGAVKRVRERVYAGQERFLNPTTEQIETAHRQLEKRRLKVRECQQRKREGQ